MKLAHAYLLLALIGVALPYASFVPWLAEHGLDLPALVRELAASRVAAFFAYDVVVSVIVLFVFIANDARIDPVPWRWVAIAGTLLVGVSFGFPLYLYLRERGSRGGRWGPGLAD